MISVFTLSQGINESVARAIDNVPAYEFATDNLSECAAEFQFALVNEASNIREIMASTDEVLVEAVFNNPAAVDALNENVFTTLKDGVVKFFNKIIAMVKGLIEKLKAFLYKMTGKTDKWLKIMEPKITAAKNNKGYGNVSAEMYNWNAGFITGVSGDCMVGGLDTLVSDWRAQCDIAGKTSSAKYFIDAAKSDTTKAKGAAGMDADGKDAADKTGEFDKATKEEVDKLEKFKSNAPDHIGKAWKIKATSMDVLTSELRKKATGGAEKIEKKFGGEVDKMVSAIKDSAKAIEKVKKVYEEHLKHLTDFKANLEKQGDELGNLGKKDNIPSGVVRAATDHVKAMYNYYMEVTRTYETAMNTVRNLNTSLIQEMCTEYMSALGKFANFKGEK